MVSNDIPGRFAGIPSRSLAANAWRERSKLLSGKVRNVRAVCADERDFSNCTKFIGDAITTRMLMLFRSRWQVWPYFFSEVASL